MVRYLCTMNDSPPRFAHSGTGAFMVSHGQCVYCVSFGGWNGVAVYCARYRICPSLPELGCHSFEREPGSDDGPITPPTAA